MNGTHFNIEHAMVNFNNVQELQDNPSVFTRDKIRSDRQNQFINIFHLCWEVYKTHFNYNGKCLKDWVIKKRLLQIMKTRAYLMTL